MLFLTELQSREYDIRSFEYWQLRTCICQIKYNWQQFQYWILFWNLFIQEKSLLTCPYLWILDRVISTKVIHPNMAIFFSNSWSFKRSISWWPLPKTNITSETELWDQICTCVLKWNTFFLYLVRDIIQCRITKHFGIL